MRGSLTTLVFFLLSVAALAQDAFKLAAPYLHFESVFFKKECRVSIVFAENNTQIHYTTNGQNPTEKATVYTQPVVLKKKYNVLKASVLERGFCPLT